MKNALSFVKRRMTTAFRSAILFAFVLSLAFGSNLYGQNLIETQNAESSEWIAAAAGDEQSISADEIRRKRLPVSNGSKSAAPGAFVDGILDQSFADANIVVERARVEAVALQPDGKILVGGAITEYKGAPTSMIVRLNANGSLDPSFNPPQMNEGVLAIAVQPDGRIIVGGTFSTVNNEQSYRIVRLNPNGSLDSTFNVVGSISSINKIAVQPDGKILVGGAFTSIKDVARNRIARLNPDGTPDASFDPGSGASATIRALALQSDGKVLIGGDFLSFNNAARNRIARLNTDGSLDLGFDPGSGANGAVRAFAVLADGKILVGGTFADFNGSPRESLVRLNQNGSLDLSFAAVDFSHTTVFDVVVQPDGKILAAGNFFTVNAASRFNIARFNADGSLDAGFVPPPLNTTVADIALQPDGKIVAGGNFYSPFNRIVRLEATGGADSSFVSGTGFYGFFNGTVFDTATQPDGKTIIVGSFSAVNGVPRANIARLNPDGTLDASFNPGTGTLGQIRTVVLEPPGGILIAGGFAAYNGATASRIARVLPNGSLDFGFSQNVGGGFTGAESTIFSLALQPDGRILAAGGFTQYKGATALNIVRLFPDGNRDPSFDPNLRVLARINKVLLQSDDKILIGGVLGLINGVSRGTAARLNPNGTVDETFNNPLSSEVQTLALQSDGKILVGGQSFFVGSSQLGSVVRLNSNGTLDNAFDSRNAFFGLVFDIIVLPDGKIFVVGAISVNGNSSGAARLNANGTLDSNFALFANGWIQSAELLPDGKYVIGGSFSAVNNVRRTGVARLLKDAPRRTLFDFDGDGRADVAVFRPANGTWYFNNSTAGFSAVNFGLAQDKLTPGDYDGDGKTDVSVFRDGFWYRLNSSTSSFVYVQFGSPGDVPVPADYDGDGRTDLAVFRRGFWFIQQSSDNRFRAEQFGLSDDKPVAADYDGDGRADIAVFRRGFWYVSGSRAGFSAMQFGVESDQPVVGDYDGDGKADQAVFRNGFWYFQRSSLGFTGVQFGSPGDVPAPADYNGDGATDLAVFRNGVWYLQQSTNGFTAVQFGVAADKPVSAASVP